MDIFHHLDALVLDSDQLFCVLTEETLRLIGFKTIYSACHPAAGSRMLEHYAPAIIIAEYDNRRDDLWSMLACNNQRGALIVATSFDGGTRGRVTAISKGADAFLPKPFSKSQLLGTLSRLLTGEAGRRCKVVMFPDGGATRRAEQNRA